MNYRHFLIAIFGAALWQCATAAAVARQDSYCPYGWEARLGSNSCYKISNADSGDEYPDAILRCQSEGGNLLVINDAYERDWVVLKFSHIGWYMSDRVWIGLKWDVNAAQWVWEDGTILQPDLLPWDSLATIEPPYPYNASATLSPDGFLSTAGPHMYYLPAICERSVALPLLCDVEDGWVQVSDVCIKSFRIPRTWDDARAQCLELGGDLLAIGDDNNKFIYASSLQDIINNAPYHWIGLYETSAFTYEWVNGAAESGEHWGISEPQGHLGYGAAYISSVVYYTGVRMSETYPYVCEKPQNFCIYGFEQLESSCYAIGITGPEIHQNWDASESYCEEFGGHLVTIESAAENEHIATTVASGRTWIGLHDPGDGSGFRWSDGRTLTETGYTNWAVTPTPGTLRCAVLNSPAGTWELIDCNSNSDFSCETGPGATIDLQYLNHPQGFCPSDSWQRFGDYCYYYSTGGEVLDWRAAELWCEDNNGELLNIMTELEQNITTGAVQVDSWIGYNDRLIEGDWIWDHYKFNLPNMYDNWGEDEPSYDGLRNCALLGSLTGEWYTDDCRNIKQYICKSNAIVIDKPPIYTTTTGAGGNCEYGWDEDVLTGYCYRQLGDVKLTFYEAERECQLYDSHLLGVNNPAEQIYLESIMPLYSDDYPNFWIAALLPNETGWTWIDGKPFIFSNWYFAPILYDEVNCAYLRRSDGMWWDESCDWRHNIICEKPGNVATTLPTTPVPPTGSPGGACDTNWEDSYTGCFYFGPDQLSWSSAEQYCISLGGHLASVRSQYEQDFLSAKLSSYNLTHWLGMSDTVYPMFFTWEDGSWPTVTPWGYQMPAYSDTQQQCVQLSHLEAGRWINTDCIKESYYICRRDYALAKKVTTAVPPNCDDDLESFHSQAKSDEHRGIPEDSTYCIAKGVGTVTWEEAQTFCSDRGAYIVSINDEVENAYVTTVFGMNKGTFWIGLTYDPSNWEYSWESGETVNYTSWDQSQPAAQVDLRECVAADNPYWSAVNCNHKYEVLCEMKDNDAITTVSPPVTTSPSVPCPEGWLGNEEFCFWISMDTTSSPIHPTECKKMNTTFASFHSKDELDTITNWIATIDDTIKKLWIGFYQMSDTLGFRWIDGSPVNFVHWAHDQPSGYRDKIQYTYWNLTDGWHVQEENSMHNIPYVCKGRRGSIPDNITRPTGTTTKTTTISTSKKPTTTKPITTKPTTKTTTTKPTTKTTTKPTTARPTTKTTTPKPNTDTTNPTANTIPSTVSSPSTSSPNTSQSPTSGWRPTGKDSHGGAVAVVVICCVFVTLAGGLGLYIFRQRKYRRFDNSQEIVISGLRSDSITTT